MTDVAEVLRAKRELPPLDDRRRAREEAGLSTAQFGEILGVAAATVSRWESGARYPRPRNLIRYVQALQALDALR